MPAQKIEGPDPLKEARRPRLVEAKPARPNPPRRPKNSSPDEVKMELRIPRAIKDTIAQEAQQRNMSMNTFLTQLIGEALEDLVPPTPPRLTKRKPS